MNENENKYNRELLHEGVSLQIHRLEEVVFESSGKWLHPLFEAEDFLEESKLDAGDLFLHDKIAGRAAASLITRMGFKKCRIDLVSSHALDVFTRFNVECTYSEVVDKIACRTEELITSEMDLDTIHLMLRKRAGRFHGLSLSVKNLSAGYGLQKVLDGLNLDLAAGHQLVISGDNGAGKSTLMKVLIGAVQPVQGTLYLSNQQLSGNRTVPSKISYVNQQSSESTQVIAVEEIVAAGLVGKRLSAKDRDYQVEIALRQTGGFHLVGRSMRDLSGGERQRVSLARCLAQKAGLILLDEPTSFLDKDAKEELLELLDRIVKSTMPTILLVSHDHEWVQRLGWPVKRLENGILC